MQWLPKRITWQWIYLVVRWVMAAYFLGWLIGSRFHHANGGPRFFIFLTNWSFLAWNAYLIISAISVSFKMSMIYCCKKAHNEPLLHTPKPYIDIDRPVGCCSRESDTTSWYHKVQWLFFYLGAESAVLVSILYWALLYSGGSVDGVNANTHLVNAIFALIDVFFSGIPVRILHFIYPSIIGSSYAVFSGIYFAAGGTNVQGDPFIYPVLDYEENPGSAIGWVLAVLLIFIPLINLLFYGLYTVKFWLTYYLWARVESKQTNEERELDDVYIQQ